MSAHTNEACNKAHYRPNSPQVEVAVGADADRLLQHQPISLSCSDSDSEASGDDSLNEDSLSSSCEAIRPCYTCADYEMAKRKFEAEAQEGSAVAQNRQSEEAQDPSELIDQGISCPSFETAKSQGEMMPKPTNQVNLLWRSSTPGLVPERADLRQLTERMGQPCEPQQSSDGVPVLNVRQVEIDTFNPSSDPQGIEHIPLHDLVTLHQQMEADRASMTGEILVPGKISGLGIKMLLDTGASVSLISTHLWENLHAADPRWTLISTNAQIRTVSGSLANVRGQVILEIAIGDQYYIHQFLVVDVREDVILGLDFLQRYQVDWSWQRGTLTLKGHEAVAFKNYKLGDSCSRRLETLTQTRVPPNSMAVVDTKIRAKCPGALPEWGVVSPVRKVMDAHGVAVASSLIDPQASTIPVMVLNCSDTEVVLPRALTLGILHPVRNVSPIVTHFDDPPCVGADLQSSQPGPDIGPSGGVTIKSQSGSTRNVDTLEEVWCDTPEVTEYKAPEEVNQYEIHQHLESLFVQSKEGLSVDQCDQLANFLRENEDVFARSAEDLGKVTIVTHKIDTGNAVPIRQPHRRVPLQKQHVVPEELEKSVGVFHFYEMMVVWLWLALTTCYSTQHLLVAVCLKAPLSCLSLCCLCVWDLAAFDLLHAFKSFQLHDFCS